MMTVSIDIIDNIAIFTLKNSSKRNVLSHRMINDLIDSFDQAKINKIGCIILRAEPDVTIWSAGHDIADFPPIGQDPLDWHDPLRQLNRTLLTYPAPVIALIEGSVWGGAFELVLNCDILVATSTVSFSMTPAKIGIPYHMTGLQSFIHHLGLHIVKELLFTAKPLTAIRAHQLGLINHIVDKSEISDYCLKMAETILTLAPQTIALMKEELRLLTSQPVLSSENFDRINSMRQEILSGDDYKEGLKAFREKRATHFKGQ
jgi:methylmalonyl-CoA decarboxylase